MPNAAGLHGDPDIGNETALWRRIHPSHWVPDHGLGGMRINSAAFYDHPNGSPMSVVIASESGGPDKALGGERKRGVGLAEFKAGPARGSGNLPAPCGGTAWPCTRFRTQDAQEPPLPSGRLRRLSCTDKTAPMTGSRPIRHDSAKKEIFSGPLKGQISSVVTQITAYRISYTYDHM